MSKLVVCSKYVNLGLPHDLPYAVNNHCTLTSLLTTKLTQLSSKSGTTSLVPRPSHRPVFDRLQYAKTEGEGLVLFIM